MIVTRGLGPTPSLTTAGLGPILIEVIPQLPHGQTSGSYGWIAAPAGQSHLFGTAQGAYGWDGAAAGLRHPHGETTGTYTWHGAAAGQIPSIPAGQASGVYGWAGVPAGACHPFGVTAGGYGWVARAYARGEVAGVIILGDQLTAALALEDRSDGVISLADR